MRHEYPCFIHYILLSSLRKWLICPAGASNPFPLRTTFPVLDQSIVSWLIISVNLSLFFSVSLHIGHPLMKTSQKGNRRQSENYDRNLNCIGALKELTIEQHSASCICNTCFFSDAFRLANVDFFREFERLYASQAWWQEMVATNIKVWSDLQKGTGAAVKY